MYLAGADARSRLEVAIASAKILLVDDEPAIVELVRYVLERSGYEVTTATDGPSGLRAALDDPPDAVLLDVMIPGLDGYRVSREIHDAFDRGELERPVPVILVTARDLRHQPELEKTTLQLSRADLVIYKPFDPDDLLFLLERVLRNRNPA